MTMKITNGGIHVGVSIATALIVLSGVAWAGWYWRDISARFEQVETSMGRNSEAIRRNEGRIDTMHNSMLTTEDFDRLMRAVGKNPGAG